MSSYNMDAALRQVINHERDDVIAGLQRELQEERAAHAQTQAEYDDLKETAPTWAHYCKFHLFQCAHCRAWDFCHESEWPQTTSMVYFKNGTCTSDELTWCTECNDDWACESPWDTECHDFFGFGLHEKDGEDLAAVLIQLAWKRYKAEDEEP